MKAFFVSTGLLAATLSPISALSSDSLSRVERLEQTVEELRLIVEQLQQRLSTQSHQPAKTQLVSTPGSSSQGPGGNYRLKKGDTLWRIANRHGVSVDSLQRSNPGINPRKLRVGMRLTIPGSKPSQKSSRKSPSSSLPSGNYRIKQGDTLGHIAQRHGIPLKRLMAANPGINPRRLFVGKKISLPGDSNPSPVSHKKPTPPKIPAPIIPPSLPDPINEPAPLPPSFDSSHPRLVDVEKSLRMSYLAELYGTSVSKLNELNEVDFPPHQLIKAGSQIYVPSR